jgi:hypothetical protein
MNNILKIVIIMSAFGLDLLLAEDTLLLKNNSKIPVKIIDIGSKDIKYKSYKYQDGPEFSINKSEVGYLIYSDGYKQEIFNDDSISNEASSKDLFVQGQVDAAHFYKRYTGATTSTLVISLISPLVGLIPAIACSTTSPKLRNLDYPDSHLFSKIDYQRGYTSQSKIIKSKRVWRNWGFALGVNVILVLISQQ